MKSLIIISSLLFQSLMNSGFAQSISTRERFNQNWSYSKLIHRQDKNSKLSVKIFKKYAWLNPTTSVALVDTTFTFLDHPQDEVNLEKISSSIVNSIDAKSLSAKKTKNGYVIEGPWKKINRFVRIDLHFKNNKFTQVTSYYRLGLKKQLESEVGELHQALNAITNIDQVTTSFIDNFFNAILNEANADDISDLITSNLDKSNISKNLLDPEEKTKLFNEVSSISKSTKEMANTSKDVSKTLSDLTNTAKDTNKILDKSTTDANKNWADSNKILDKSTTDANKNWADSNKILDKNTTDANKNWTETNRILDNGEQNTNENWKKANEIASKALDPSHMAKLAFFTAAGAALGGVVVNLAIDGVSAGVSFLYELITKTKQKKAQWSDFQIAMEKWDPMMNLISDYEKTIDKLLTSFNFLEKNNIDNQYIKNVQLAKAEAMIDAKDFQKLVDNQSINRECRIKIQDSINTLGETVKEYDRVLQFNKDNKEKLADGNKYFCDQLEEILSKVFELEKTLSDARVAILTASSQMLDKANEVDKTRNKEIANINQLNQEKLIAFNDKELSLARERKAQWVNQCYDLKNSEGIKIREEYSSFTFFFRGKSRCEEAYALLKVEAPALTEDELHQKLQASAKVSLNSDVSTASQKSMDRFLTKLSIESECYPFANKDENDIPLKCKKFPGIMKGMGLGRVAKKAQDLQKNKCQDNYLNGLNEMANL